MREKALLSTFETKIRKKDQWECVCIASARFTTTRAVMMAEIARTNAQPEKTRRRADEIPFISATTTNMLRGTRKSEESQ